DTFKGSKSSNQQADRGKTLLGKIKLGKIKSHIAVETRACSILAFLCTALAIALLVMQNAWAATFNTPLSVAEWQVQSSPLECQLSHEISHYGTAIFAYKAGESETLLLNQQQTRLPAGELKITVSEPGWEPEFSTQAIGVV